MRAIWLLLLLGFAQISGASCISSSSSLLYTKSCITVPINPAPSWVPQTASSSKAIFESDVNVTNASGKASQWIDQKSAITVAEATSANQPAIHSNALNTLQTLTFNGSTTRLTAASNPYAIDLSHAFSIYVVAKPAAFSGTQYFCSFILPTTQTLRGAWFTFSSDPNYSDYGWAAGNQSSYLPLQRSGALGIDTSNFRVYKVFYNGAGLSLSNYGYQKDSGSVATPVSNGGTDFVTTSAMTIGMRYGDGGASSDSPFSGDIASIYIFNADLRPSGTNEDSKMMTYVQWKYGAI